MNKVQEKNIYFKDFVPFTFKKIGNSYLLVNEWGDYLLLSAEEFLRVESFKHNDNSKLHKKLHANNFLIENLNITSLTKSYKEKNLEILSGPSNFDIFFNDIKIDSVFSDKKRGAKEEEISTKVIDEILSKILLTSSKKVLIKIREINLFNLDKLKYLIKKAEEIAKKYKKDFEVELHIDINLINDNLLKLVDKNNVIVSFIFSGNTITSKKDFKKEINKFYKKVDEISKNRVLKSEVLINSSTIKFYKEIVDINIKSGFKKIYYRELNKYEVSASSWKKHGLSSGDISKFYKNLLEYLLKNNLDGCEIKDNLTENFLRKVNKLNLKDREFSSPCAAGINRLSFNKKGDVFLCNKALRMSLINDKSFMVGNIRDLSLGDIANSKVLKTICLASCNDSLPGCDVCIYKPYCGPCPVNNYHIHGDPFAQKYGKDRCGFIINSFDLIFKFLENKKYIKIFNKWIKQ